MPDCAVRAEVAVQADPDRGPEAETRRVSACRDPQGECVSGGAGCNLRGAAARRGNPRCTSFRAGTAGASGCGRRLAGHRRPQGPPGPKMGLPVRDSGVCVCVCVCLSVCVSVCLCVSPTVSPTVCASVRSFSCCEPRSPGYMLLSGFPCRPRS